MVGAMPTAPPDVAAPAVARPVGTLRGRRAAAAPQPEPVRRPPVPLAVAVLTVGFLLVGLALPHRDPHERALVAAALWLLAGGLVLRPRHLLLHLLVAGTAIAAGMIPGVGGSAPGVVLTLLVVDGVVLGYGTTRQRTVQRDERGESMLVDLRDRLGAPGPAAGAPSRAGTWRGELRAAHGESFSGDFLVATRSLRPGWVELALVDVSGKGRRAGTRALMLSGAFGGILGALPPGASWRRPTGYVLRQGWDEGFATAVHLALDMSTGAFRVGGGRSPAGGAVPRRVRALGAGGRPNRDRCWGVLGDPLFPSSGGRLESWRRVAALHRRPGRDPRARRRPRHRPAGRAGRAGDGPRLPRRGAGDPGRHPVW